MTGFQEVYEWLKKRSEVMEVTLEGEFITSTCFAVLATNKGFQGLKDDLEKVWGARVFDHVPAEKWPEDQPDVRAANCPSRLDAFRFYVPPTENCKIFATSDEVQDKIVQTLNTLLEMAPDATRRLMSQNFQCPEEFAQNHPTIRCNAAINPESGQRVATFTPWGVICGIVEELTGDRLNFKTVDDVKVEQQKVIPIQKFMRAKK